MEIVETIDIDGLIPHRRLLRRWLSSPVTGRSGLSLCWRWTSDDQLDRLYWRIFKHSCVLTLIFGTGFISTNHQRQDMCWLWCFSSTVYSLSFIEYSMVDNKKMLWKEKTARWHSWRSIYSLGRRKSEEAQRGEEERRRFTLFFLNFFFKISFFNFFFNFFFFSLIFFIQSNYEIYIDIL